MDWNLATPEEAIMMGSFVPAVSCHIDDVCGSIEAGRAADFIVLDQKNESSCNLSRWTKTV
uniref:CAZy families CE9 protein n=1 Tax=uncultured Streptococcus sp. TaxID=83427 RepID=A0A060C8U1_9STRE|nr:CAZy families CE9 protein [uncultured Streptococcus sp.]